VFLHLKICQFLRRFPGVILGSVGFVVGCIPESEATRLTQIFGPYFGAIPRFEGQGAVIFGSAELGDTS
jgi:hypothetical protein